MKAILNVSKFNQYSKYNGLTFDVVELLRSMVALNIEGRTTDFTFKEVIIVDIKNELSKAFNGGEKTLQDFLRLRDYAVENKIKTGAETIYTKVKA